MTNTVELMTNNVAIAPPHQRRTVGATRGLFSCGCALSPALSTALGLLRVPLLAPVARAGHVAPNRQTTRWNPRDTSCSSSP
eukprot:598937-Rhodomonas_salina.1